MQEFIKKKKQNKNNKKTNQHTSNLINELHFLKKSKSWMHVDNLQISLIKLTFISKTTFTLCQEKQACCFPGTGAEKAFSIVNFWYASIRKWQRAVRADDIMIFWPQFRWIEDQV